VIAAEVWAEILRLHRVEHLSQQLIAQRLGIHRETVAHALASEVAPRYHRPPRDTLVTPFLPLIEERLRDFPEISAARLLDELHAAGYRGGYSILKQALRTLRPRQLEAFVRRETAPGQEAQVDWGSFGVLDIGGARRPLSCFVMVLGYSRMLWLRFTVSQRMEDFLRGHVDAFAFFGGVPHRILYDNLRSVVLARSGSTVRFHPRFVEFSGAYLFEPRPCGVRRANEKGKVEVAIRYIRTSFFSGRRFRDLGDLNAQAARWRDEIANPRLHSVTRERPIDRWPRDRANLVPLPARPFDTDVIVPVRASQQCLVRFDGNAYSVPFEWAGRPLLLRGSPLQIRLFDKDRLAAQHERCYGRHQVIEEPDHVRRLLERKRAARAVKARDVLLDLCPEGKLFLEGLLRLGRRLDAHLTAIDALVHIYGDTAVAGAIAKAVQLELFAAGYLEQLLRGSSEPSPRTPVSVPGHPEVEQTVVRPHSLEVYEHGGPQQDKDKAP
jgi:transposase